MSNRKLMEEIRKSRAICDKSCNEYKDEREVVGNQWLVTLKINVASAQQRYSNMAEQTSPSKKSSSSSHLLQLHLSSYISHHKDESKRKLALQQDDFDPYY